MFSLTAFFPLLIHNFGDDVLFSRVFPVTQLIKNLPAMWETWVRSLGWEDTLEKGTLYSLQYSGLESSMVCVVHRVAKSWTFL